jgi:hypothetical protein
MEKFCFTRDELYKLLLQFSAFHGGRYAYHTNLSSKPLTSEEAAVLMRRWTHDFIDMTEDEGLIKKQKIKEIYESKS